jgi:glycosyltransferase involved in cell wall biosynthesis
VDPLVILENKKNEIIMKRPSPLLTMGMPVYNEEKYIAEAIESLLAQTYKDFALVISDNASNDRTPAICKYYAAKDSRITYVRHPKNNGSLFNFSYVLKRANTPFFMWCGGHDKWHPQFIEKLLPIIETEDLVLVYPKTMETNMDGALGEIYEDDYTTVEKDKPYDRFSYIMRHIGKCNALHGIWGTKVLRDIYVDPVFGYDVIVLAQAAIKGKFKQQGDILFFRRAMKREENKYQRQLPVITGNHYQKSPSEFLIKCKFILDNIKILYQNNTSLSIVSKFLLSIKTIYIWTERFYLIPFSIKIFKQSLPRRLYYQLRSNYYKLKGIQKI